MLDFLITLFPYILYLCGCLLTALVFITVFHFSEGYRKHPFDDFLVGATCFLWPLAILVVAGALLLGSLVWIYRKGTVKC